MSNNTARVFISARDQFRNLAAWLAVLLLPWFTYINSVQSLSNNQASFLALVSGAVVMWVFRLVPDFVPGLLLIVLVSLLNIAPQSVAFSGFYSQIFFLVLGIFILAAVLSESSWLGRLERKLSNNDTSLFGKLLTLVAATFTLTLIVPSPLGRATMIKPLADRFINQSPASNTLVLLAQTHGSTLLSTVFLTGNPLNFLLLAAMSEQYQTRFQWIGWLQASALAMMVLSLGFILLLLMANYLLKPELAQNHAQPLLHHDEPPQKVTPIDWAVLALYGFFIIGVITQSIHQVPLAWVVVLLALAVFCLGGLSVDSLRSKVDWPTLLFIATVVAWGEIIQFVGLADWFSQQMLFLEAAFLSSLYTGLTLLIATVVLVRFILPGAPAFILLSATLIPFADVLGISPWVIGFVVLTMSESFVLPYQHGVFSQAISEASAQNHPLRYAFLIRFNLWITALKVLAIFASIPLWQSLNLI